ncbi:transcription factor AP-1 [Callorhinchus milii]|uniref:transcription factor AP-1 n=1 Tax=Callorhinchus milii TaxID=7868 RepID=UPI001C3FAC6E|nr:transcription factor AP-1 [Callorhinchus milii]
MSTRMEQPFYHDDAFGQPESAAYGYSPKFLKQNLTLNLSDPNSSLKPHLRNKGAEGILTSPDVGLLKLASPELERLIIQSSNGMVTTTPTPTQFLCPRNVTDEQEGFAEGFVKALEELHKQNVLPTAATCPGTPPAGTTPTPAPGPAPTSAPTPTPTPGSSLPNSAPPYNSNLHQEPPVYANLSNFNPNAIGGYSGDMNYTPSQQQPQHQHHHHHHHHQHQQHQHPPPPPPPLAPGAPLPGQLHPRLQALKEEPQTVPEMSGETPPLSPIDMESQERIKAERKRMRNRIAASKCRKRKLERIARLEDKVKSLKSQNSELSSTANLLREQVAQLKQKVMNHVTSGCQLMLTQQLQTF